MRSPGATCCLTGPIIEDLPLLCISTQLLMVLHKSVIKFHAFKSLVTHPFDQSMRKVHSFFVLTKFVRIMTLEDNPTNKQTERDENTTPLNSFFMHFTNMTSLWKSGQMQSAFNQMYKERTW